MSSWEKLETGTEYAYPHMFYPVTNIRGGYTLAPINPVSQMNQILSLPELQTHNDFVPLTKRRGRPRKHNIVHSE